jgi:hypothetical protein
MGKDKLMIKSCFLLQERQLEKNTFVIPVLDGSNFT